MSSVTSKAINFKHFQTKIVYKKLFIPGGDCDFFCNELMGRFDITEKNFLDFKVIRGSSNHDFTHFARNFNPHHKSTSKDYVWSIMAYVKLEISIVKWLQNMIKDNKKLDAWGMQTTDIYKLYFFFF